MLQVLKAEGRVVALGTLKTLACCADYGLQGTIPDIFDELPDLQFMILSDNPGELLICSMMQQTLRDSTAAGHANADLAIKC